MKDIVKLALKIANEAHKGKFRNDGKTPYVTHPIAVAESLKRFWGPRHPGLSTVLAIALLHDVVEDSDISITDLWEQGIPESVTIPVRLLTRVNEDYLCYILNIKQNYLARMVKIEDLKHNLSTLDPKKETMKAKYQLALYILEH
jgi:(p)ppGpp synthase/HD superfamily hydrolase